MTEAAGEAVAAALRRLAAAEKRERALLADLAATKRELQAARERLASPTIHLPPR